MNSHPHYITLTDDNFQEEIIENPKPFLVKFVADWSGPCHIMTPIIDELITEFQGQIIAGEVDVDFNQRLLKEYGIRELPTILFFKNGQVVDHIIGSAPKIILAEKLSTLINL